MALKNIFKKILSEGQISILVLMLLLWDITSILLVQKDTAMNDHPGFPIIMGIMAIIFMLGILSLESGLMMAVAVFQKKEKIHFLRLMTCASICHTPLTIGNIIRLILPNFYNGILIIELLTTALMFSLLIQYIFNSSFIKSLSVSFVWFAVIFSIMKYVEAS